MVTHLYAKYSAAFEKLPNVALALAVVPRFLVNLREKANCETNPDPYLYPASLFSPAAETRLPTGWFTVGYLRLNAIPSK